ncbi:MAG: hypothetical protein R2705_07645 [Ilumatobacteraceae bacterium]
MFYENGLSINVMYDPREPKKRAVGFKLSDGMTFRGGARIPLQVRPPEVQTGRHHPGLVLRHQGRVRVALIIDVHRCVGAGDLIAIGVPSGDALRPSGVRSTSTTRSSAAGPGSS